MQQNRRSRHIPQRLINRARITLPTTRMIDNIQLPVPLPQTAAGDIPLFLGTRRNHIRRIHRPDLPIDGLRETDAALVVFLVAHVEHAVVIPRGGVAVREHARVARLRHVDAAHGVCDCDATVRECHAVSGLGPAGLGVRAVEVDEEFLGLRVPFCVWGGDVRNAVLARPDVRDDWVGSVFGPGPFDVVGVEEGNATWVVMRRIIEVPVCERVFKVETGLEDGGEDVSLGVLILILVTCKGFGRTESGHRTKRGYILAGWVVSEIVG